MRDLDAGAQRLVHRAPICDLVQAGELLVVQVTLELEAEVDALEQMGARHVGYGAQPAHYPIVRDTLLATLAQFAGDLWTQDLADAWERAINAVAGLMLTGAENAQRDAA